MNSWRRRAAPWLALLAGLAGCDCSETPETDDETSEAVAPPGPGHVPITCQPDFLLDAAGRCVRWVRLGGLSRDRHAGALIHVGAGRVLAVGGMAKPDFAARKAETEPPPPPPYADAELYDSATHRQVMSFALGAPRRRAKNPAGR